MKCPGQDMRNLKVSLHRCPNCGYEVEMFSDEMRIRCPKCRTMIFKENVPSCIEWCSSARECLGEERWKQLLELVADEEKKGGPSQTEATSEKQK